MTFHTESTKPARFKYQLTDWVSREQLDPFTEPHIKYNDHDYAVVVKKMFEGMERFAIFTKGERLIAN